MNSNAIEGDRMEDLIDEGACINHLDNQTNENEENNDNNNNKDSDIDNDEEEGVEVINNAQVDN